MNDRSYEQCAHFQKYSGKKFPGDVELGLGDHVENVLKQFGITKELWSLVTAQVGNCGSCNKRQRFLNNLGRKLGMGEGRNELNSLLDQLVLDEQPIYNCSLKGKCLGREVFDDVTLHAIRSADIEPCQHCNDFSPKEK